MSAPNAHGMPATRGSARRGLAAACSLFLIAACSDPAAAPTSTSPATVETTPATDAPSTSVADSGPVNRRIYGEIAQNGPTLELATQLFSLEVQPLPGVTAPDGPVEPQMSGTYAYMLAASYYDQLDPAQQAVLDHTFVQGPDVGSAAAIDAFTNPPDLPPLPTSTTEVPPTTTEPATTEPATTTTALATTTTAVTQGARLGAVTRSRADEVDLLDAYFRPLYQWASNAIHAKTGQAPLEDFLLAFGPLEGATWAESTTWHDGVRYQSNIEDVIVHACHSHVDIDKFANQPFDAQLSVVTHEVMHCYQQDAASSGAQVASTPGWVSEGEATWVQMALVPSPVIDKLQTHWEEYASHPNTVLFLRRYDAAGFFGHVADVAGDDAVWPTLIPAYVSGDNESRFTTFVAGHEDAVLDTWAPSYFRSHDGQFLWDMKGPGKVNMPTAAPPAQQIDVPSGAVVALPTVSRWQLSLVKLASQADILTVIVPLGHAVLIDSADSANKVLTGGHPVSLCLQQTCECPPDQEGTVPTTIPATAPLDLGLTGGRKGAQGYVVASSLSEFCKRKQLPDDPNGPPGGGGGGGGGDLGGQEPSAGKVIFDPHLITYDGRWYDLHALGEFVLTRDQQTGLEVQARFETRDARTWSAATSMATRVGKDRVTVSIDLRAQRLPELRVNGVRVTDDFRMLDGGSVRRTAGDIGDNYVVEMADGTRVGVTTTPRGGMAIWVDPATSMHGHLTGLLGDYDGKASNDPVVKGTRTVLAAEPTYDELYTTFANSWRVTQDESLFDYAARESTSTFTDTTFPDRDTPAASEAQLSAASDDCAASGVADEQLLQACAFDLAASGEPLFAWAYGTQQRRDDTWRQLTGEGGGTVPTPSGTTRTQPVSFDGEVATADQKVTKTFQGFKDDIVWVDPTDCQLPRFAQLLDPQGQFVGSNHVGCGDRLVLPADGTYTIDMNPFDEAARFHVSIVPVRPDLVRTIKPGDTLQGTIATPPEHDVFLVEAAAGDTITFGTDNCTGDFDVVINLGDELVTAGPGCRLGTVEFPTAGTYQIIVNNFNAATGDYSFPTS